jgi:hypothetical protein
MAMGDRPKGRGGWELKKRTEADLWGREWVVGIEENYEGGWMRVE